MTCIYTGAHVYVPSHAIHCAADIFEVSGVIVIRFPIDPTKDARSHEAVPVERITHIVDLSYIPEAALFERLDLGVIVIDKRFVRIGPAHKDYRSAQQQQEDRAKFAVSRSSNQDLAS